MKGFVFKPALFTSLKGYKKETLMADIMAGIIVGIVALPLAIAFGIASGVSPEKALSQLLLQVWPYRYSEAVGYRLVVLQVHSSLSSTALSNNTDWKG